MIQILLCVKYDQPHQCLYSFYGLVAELKTENTQGQGKYHYTAGLQFYKFGFNCFTA